MKRYFSLVALATLVPLGSVNQAAAATATAALDTNSAYVWRGLTFNDGLVLQPSLDVSTGGFAVNVWGNLDIDDYNGAVDDGEFSEVDLTASYTWKLGPMDASLGAIEYLFPGGAEATTELFAGLAYALVPGLTASGKFFYDVDQVDDYYLSLGLAYAYTLSEKTTFSLGGSVGLAGEDFAGFYAGGTDSGLFNYTLTAGIKYLVTDALAVGAAINYSESLDDDVLPDEAVDTTVYGGVSLAYTF